MKNYGIMRFEKIKTRGDLSHRLGHNNRDKCPRNADPSKTDLNRGSSNTERALKQYEKLLPEKYRKDAVKALEFVFTTSHEFGQTENSRFFLRDAQKWAMDKFGVENMISNTLHKDELTPHIHMIFMPLVDGKLNAYHYFKDGKRSLSAMQDDFYEQVSKKYGLHRGEKREKVRHTTTKEWSKVMKKKEQELAEREANLNPRLVTKKYIAKATKKQLREVKGFIADRINEIEY